MLESCYTIICVAKKYSSIWFSETQVHCRQEDLLPLCCPPESILFLPRRRQNAFHFNNSAYWDLLYFEKGPSYLQSARWLWVLTTLVFGIAQHSFFFFLLLPKLILLNMWKGQNRKSFYCTYWSKFHTTTEEKTKLDINAKLKTLTERVMTACIDTSFMLPQREKNFNVIELPDFWFERGTSTKLLASSSVVRNKLFLLILPTYFLNLHQTNSSKMKL